MNRRMFPRIILVVLVVVFPTLTFAQAEQPGSLPVRIPREFAELRGTWLLDESVGTGHIVGLPVAHTLVTIGGPSRNRHFHESEALVAGATEPLEPTRSTTPRPHEIRGC